jgi:hypothetical protein
MAFQTPDPVTRQPDLVSVLTGPKIGPTSPSTHMLASRAMGGGAHRSIICDVFVTHVRRRVGLGSTMETSLAVQGTAAVGAGASARAAQLGGEPAGRVGSRAAGTGSARLSARCATTATSCASLWAPSGRRFEVYGVFHPDGCGAC